MKKKEQIHALKRAERVLLILISFLIRLIKVPGIEPTEIGRTPVVWWISLRTNGLIKCFSGGEKFTNYLETK